VHPGKAREQPLQCDLRLETGEVHPDAHVRPLGERHMQAGVVAREVKPVG